MHKLIDYVCDELMGLEDKLDRQGGLSDGDLKRGDMLAHFGKNLTKLEEQGGSYEGSYDGSYDGYSRGGGSYDGASYRGRRNARRDSMGRYSREGYSRAAAEDMANSLRAMMKEAPDDNIKRDMERLVERMEQVK